MCSECDKKFDPAKNSLWLKNKPPGKLYPDNDEIVAIQHNWWKSFAILPHKTVSGRWVWLQTIYKRVVWKYTGFVDEPFTEYGEFTDVVKTA